MKTHETISLNIGATILAGLTSSLLVLFLSSASSPIVIASPLLLSLLAAFFQYRFVMKPWHKTLGELLSKALNLQESASANPGTPPVSVANVDTRTKISSNSSQNQLGLLRESIEIATERFKENRLRENALIQHAVDVICVIDLNSKLLSVNPASSSVWGYRPDELIGKQITDFLVSDDVKNTMKALLGAEKSIDKLYFENRFRKKTGEIVDLLWSAHLSATDRGLFCIAHDITERKRAEQMLRESEQRVRGILESLPAGVAVIADDGRIEFMNQTALDLSGYNATDSAKVNAKELISLSSGESFNAEQLLAKSENSFDCIVSKITGERFPAEASVRQLSWGKGKACLLIFLDATLKHEVEQAKREFVAMVSHDLRTPLTAISLIFSYMLDGLAGELTEDGADFARRGQNSCDRLMNLVQDLLDLEKMRAGKFVMDRVETSIKELVDASFETVKPYADAQGILLSRSTADLKCICDGGRIIQVLVNLLSNAVKFSTTGGTVNLALKASDETVIVQVSNRGKTISPEKLNSIFEKFEQADARGAVERKGTGLGLTISKTIIEQHNGKIWVESSDESGTTFSFTLPKYIEESDESESEDKSV